MATLAVETSPGSGVYADLTGYLLHGSLTLKFNTIDFSLIDPPLTACQLTAAIKTTNPAWNGTVATRISSDPVDRVGHYTLTVTGTNTNVLPNDTAPFDLADVSVPATLGDYLLESGSGHYLLEDGTDWAPGAYLLEQPYSKGYSGLSVQTTVSTTPGGPPTTLGQARVVAPGLRPGNQFRLTSANQGYSAAPFRITQVTTRWPGRATDPLFDIEFGDTPQTLAQWSSVTAPAIATPVAPVTPPAPAFVPAGIAGNYGGASTGHTLYPMGGGIVTLASASFSVSAPSGHSLTVQLQGAIDARMRNWDNYVAAPRRAVRAVISGGIYTGAWQELPFGLTRAIYDLSSAAGIALPSGTYTVSLQIITTEYNQMEVFSGWAQAAVSVV